MLLPCVMQSEDFSSQQREKAGAHCEFIKKNTVLQFSNGFPGEVCVTLPVLRGEVRN